MVYAESIVAIELKIPVDVPLKLVSITRSNSQVDFTIGISFAFLGRVNPNAYHMRDSRENPLHYFYPDTKGIA